MSGGGIVDGSNFATPAGRDGVFTSAPELPCDAGLAAADNCSSASFCAFSMICSCFAGSLARIPTRSVGTGVFSLKFFENLKRSFNLCVLSVFAF